MEWFKRASGLKIFAAIWILVALTPLWRLRAARQWNDDQLNGPNMEMKLDLTPERERELARRFPNDPIAQTSPTSLQLMDVNRLTDDSPPSELAVALKDEYRVMRGRTEPVFNRFARLSRQFPDSQIVRAQWLRDTTRGSLLIEPRELQATYNQPHTVYPTENWMSQTQIERAIGAAQSGAKIEPDNAFWPWMEAILDFSLRRDDAALSALEMAGRCARFDDKILETVRARIDLLKRAQTMDFDDQIHEAWAILLPHLARIRSASRAALWQAKLAQKRGDGARALQIAGIVMRAARPLSRDSQSYINRLVGQAIVNLAWKDALENAKVGVSERDPETAPWTDENRNQYIREAGSKFVALARTNGRADLADEAQSLMTAALSDSRLIAAFKDPAFDNLPQAQTQLGLWHWASSWALRLAFYSAMWWIIGFVASLGRKGLDASARRKSVIWSAFCVGATVAILIVSLQLGAAGASPYYFDLLTSAAPLLLFNFHDDLPLLLGAVWGVPVLLTTLVSLFSRPRLEAKPSGPRNWPLLAQLGLYAGTLGSFFFWSGALGQPLEDTVAGQFWPAPALIFCGFTLATCACHIWRARGAMKPCAILFSLAVLLTLLVTLYEQGQPYPPSNRAFFELYGLAALWMLAFYAWIRASGIKLLWSSPLLSALAQRIRLASATLAVCSSVFYFGLLLAAMPLRHHAQGILDAQLQIGEIGYVESKLKQLEAKQK
ncbi:hypothetical protein B1R32_102198 [Abditibacterium utsteinense]|uniref:Uncharacterized protein n=1 Tax=Abditibacterium utsteinense TaxID=1960156 RepID=A0A2S8SWQ4_9BACT|nr:hypothetical protein [Abditibacterium utsteinense]PQV65189.1 hypothetical protein B1R32_102198 [Abditibacterium utsteinense]